MSGAARSIPAGLDASKVEAVEAPALASSRSVKLAELAGDGVFGYGLGLAGR